MALAQNNNLGAKSNKKIKRQKGKTFVKDQILLAYLETVAESIDP